MLQHYHLKNPKIAYIVINELDMSRHLHLIHSLKLPWIFLQVPMKPRMLFSQKTTCLTSFSPKINLSQDFILTGGNNFSFEKKKWIHLLPNISSMSANKLTNLVVLYWKKVIRKYEFTMFPVGKGLSSPCISFLAKSCLVIYLHLNNGLLQQLPTNRQYYRNHPNHKYEASFERWLAQLTPPCNSSVESSLRTMSNATQQLRACNVLVIPNHPFSKTKHNQTLDLSWSLLISLDIF